MPTISTTKMTAEQFMTLGEDPPGVRLVLVDGEVAASPSPAPKHSHVVVNLLTILNNHILENDLGALYQDVDTQLDDFNIRRPDILFYTNENLDRIG
jgi:Uma2 family endonuclease